MAALLGLPLVSAAPASANASSQWPLEYLKATQDWSISKGQGATVAVLDTGVASIADTQDRLGSGADFSSGSGHSTGNGENDIYGHGTGMAVIIAGSGSTLQGLAPAAKILPVRITTGGTSGPDTMADGIEYAITQHASVINLSQRASSSDSNLAKAIQDAESAGIVVVAATGNEGSSSVDSPASLPGVVAVGAIDQSGSLASFSNTGPQVTVVAPGANVPQEDETGATATANGTSASTAYVSATAALIRSAHPTWTAGQVIRDLISTADPASGMSAGQHNDQYGYGIVDPLKALQASAPSDTSNPLLGTAGSTASAAPTTGANQGTPTASTSTSNSGLVIAAIIAVIVVILIIVLIIALSRRNRGGKGGPGAGGPGGGPQYGQQYPQQQGNPYYQPGQQQPPYPPQQGGGGQQPPYPGQGNPPKR